MSHTPKIPGIQNGVTTIQTNVSTLQTDVDTVEGNITTLQSDISAIESDITTLQSDVSTLQTNSTEDQTNSTETFTNTYSLSLDGSNDYVDCGTVAALNSATNFSVSMWVNFQSFVANGANYNIILGSGSHTGNRFILNVVRTSSTIANRLEVYHCESYASIVGTSLGLTTNTWYHMAAYKNGSNMSFYINNSLMGSRTNATTSDGNGGSNFAIGRGIYNGLYSANIIVDEVAVWGSDQSSNRDSIYNSGVPGDISSLSPTHWWRMGDNDGGTGTTITDQGSGGNDGTLTNGPTFSTDVPEEPGFTNTYSLSLDGSDDYLSISSSSYTISGNKSFSAWVKPTSGLYHYLWGYGTNLYALYFESSTVTIRMWSSGNGGSSTGRTYQAMTSPVTISLNSWYNITITGDGTTLKLYVNGQSAASTYTDNNDWYFETALRAGNAGASFAGLVDEFAFFNTTLTSSEVSAIYGNGTPSSLSDYNPHLWWRMGDDDSGTGTTITDQGSGGNNATLTNGPTFSTTVPS